MNPSVFAPVRLPVRATRPTQRQRPTRGRDSGQRSAIRPTQPAPGVPGQQRFGPRHRRGLGTPASAPSLTALAWGIAAAIGPMAAVVVPLYFNPRTERVFEPDKLAWLLFLALLGAASVFVIAASHATSRPPAQPQAAKKAQGPATISKLRSVPALAWAIGALASVTLLATLWSEVPLVSLWGTYRRANGLAAHLSYVVICFAVAITWRLPGTRARLRFGLLLPGIPVALYALLQRAGVDSIPWRIYGTSTLERPFGPMGNPIFLGAYLAMIIPLAIADCLEERSTQSSSTSRSRCLVDGATVVLAVLALVASASRGPLLALGTAGLIFGLVWTARRGHRRWAMALVVGAALGFLGLALLGRTATDGHRLLELLSPASRTARERLLVWQGLSDLMVADPRRAVIGYGPQTLAYVLGPHLPEELIRLAPSQIFDQAHNLLWEWWVSAGLLGVTAVLLLYGCAFFGCLSQLGLLATLARQRMLIASLAVGSLLGAAGAMALDIAYLGLGIPLGMLAGLLLFLLGHSAVAAPQRVEPQLWLPAGILAALGAHLAEASLGVPTAPAELLFWLLVGALVALSSPSAGSPGGAGQESQASLLAGMQLATVTHAPLGQLAAATASRPLVLGLLLPASWLAGDAFPGLRAGTSIRRPWARLLFPALVVAGLLALRRTPGGSAIAFGAVLLVATIGLAWAIARELPGQEGARLSNAARLAAALAALAVLLASSRFVFAPILADAHIRSGLEVAARGDPATARRHFSRARQLWPAQPAFAEYLAAVDRDVMMAAETPAEVRLEAFRVADQTLSAALERVPDPIMAMRHAMLWRDWGDVAPDDPERQQAWREAAKLFAAARARAPSQPRLLCEEAKLQERLDEQDKARANYARAVWLDPSLAEAWAGLVRLTLLDDGLAAARLRLDEALGPGGVAGEQLAEALAAATSWPISQLGVLGAQVLYYGRVGRLTDATAALRQLRDLPGSSSLAAQLEMWLAGERNPSSGDR